ncbi:nucleic acid-binding protein [Exilibacterium tricleocarpae]|uniref:Large ribosomal RNA subunit accumulation protein YceD n=1 Tax=Exilibacterium tricleocarpae TaxID=2591008 RepID=A0A545T8C7_9GAMM|nr:YceD family protein [Exilibacterium tricleocarpae]TQV73483.1 nucleic acid-binding protein [Exilibacterium tricleocarpae]
MSDAPQKQVLPRRIDPRKFAQQGVNLAGDIAVSDLARLTEASVGDGPPVRAALAFGINEEKARTLTGTLDGQVNLVCQRCLEPVAVPLHCALNLVLVWDEEDARQLPRRLDPWIVGEGTADLYEVLEEELLLALPMVAYHAEACIDPALLSGGEATGATGQGGQKNARFSEANREASESNPFKVLEQLKKTPK